MDKLSYVRGHGGVTVHGELHGASFNFTLAGYTVRDDAQHHTTNPAHHLNHGDALAAVVRDQRRKFVIRAASGISKC